MTVLPIIKQYNSNFIKNIFSKKLFILSALDPYYLFPNENFLEKYKFKNNYIIFIKNNWIFLGNSLGVPYIFNNYMVFNLKSKEYIFYADNYKLISSSKDALLKFKEDFKIK